MKEESREEIGHNWGVPPAARNVKGNVAARNKMLIEYGAEKAVEEGLI